MWGQSRGFTEWKLRQKAPELSIQWENSHPAVETKDPCGSRSVTGQRRPEKVSIMMPRNEHRGEEAIEERNMDVQEE